MNTIQQSAANDSEAAASIITLEDAAKAELKRKAGTIKAHRQLSADEALERAMQWQQQETGQADGFALTEPAAVYHYRVWYKRTSTMPGYECVVVRSDTKLYQWASIHDYLAHRIRETHDAQCKSVATFVESALNW